MQGVIDFDEISSQTLTNLNPDFIALCGDASGGMLALNQRIHREGFYCQAIRNMNIWTYSLYPIIAMRWNANNRGLCKNGLSALILRIKGNRLLKLLFWTISLIQLTGLEPRHRVHQRPPLPTNPLPHNHPVLGYLKFGRQLESVYQKLSEVDIWSKRKPAA